jgi:hypothetical protein
MDEGDGLRTAHGAQVLFGGVQARLPKGYAIPPRLGARAAIRLTHFVKSSRRDRRARS